MKKSLMLLLVGMLMLSMLLTGCGGGTVEEDEVVEEGEVVEEEVVEEVDFFVGLVTDVGGIDDKSFNQGTWEGVERFAAEFGSDKNFLQSEEDADYLPNLSAFADEGADLIVAPGFLFLESLAEAASNFPNQKFLLIDEVVDAPNVVSAVFSEEEGSFLVGVAAALKAQEAGQDTVGYIGGIDFELIQRFEAGFEAGVWAVDPDMTVLVEYAGAFDSAQTGQALAARLYDQGAYVIYHAAGGTGNGLIREARDRRLNGEDVWAIGVDKDQFEDGIYEGDSSAVLTSMMKRVDVAAYDIAKMALEGNFPGGEVYVFNLENEGVGLPENNPNLSDEIVTQVRSYIPQVVSGELEVPTLPVRLQED
ncbi:basic membrane lipoprotein [Alkaliphilus metalliredigens QYMF]|uniref:Basic membrane lipoprotein n=1 Tax=Alkaliphilus metalliredigens (strain QYMF) TaxID=293826 RepID=A6TU42_ALKMQ|nr:BMP family ABC transporter substrate-binding protein [Alkaliphilus metalliredigens]ABR49710.1 basic membrane lipoprotein [Alkaliphilus metalliredigens QYMF]